MQTRHGNYIILSLVLVSSLVGFNYAFGASSFSIHTNKSVYEYGDRLSLIFEVSELTENSLTFQIIDYSGKASSPIPIQITSLKTEITAPVPFYKTTFKSGAYHVNATYSGSHASTFFTLVDSDKIAIPFQYKILARLWSEGNQSTDANFANVIRDLIQYEIIKIPESMNQSTNSKVHIPSWVKNDARWWSDGLISDNDFGIAIQYLVKTKIITV